MDIQTEKAQLIHQLQLIDDIDLIRLIRNMMDYAMRTEEFSEHDIEEYNKDLDQAEEEIENGKVISHEDLSSHGNCCK